MLASSYALALLAALPAAAPTPAAPAATTGLHVIKSISVPGEGGWDYLTLDPEARRLYVTRGDHVSVLDVDTEKVVGEIKDTAGVHGVALAPALKRGFASNGRANTVTIFDTATLAKIGEVKTGAKPDAILYDAATQRVFAFDGDSSDATVIDAATGTVAATIPLGGQPEFGVADGGGMVFVNLEDKSELVAIDSRAMKVKSRWSLAPCEAPTGLAIDVAKRRLFSGCHSQVMAISDADKGQVIGTVPIGRGVDGAAFDAELGLAYSSNGEGTLTVVREDAPGHYSVVENVKTQAGARTMTVDPRTHRLYLATAQFGPPPPATAEQPRPRPSLVPGTFVILVVGK
jgi:YVTN family beta-propeller protein